MFGVKFVKFEPNLYVYKYKKGKVRSAGAGLAFWYYAPSTSLVVIPIQSVSAPYIFEISSSDFQPVTVQGEVIYRIAEPDRIREKLNYGIHNRQLTYISEDPQLLSQRIINIVNMLVKNEFESITLKEMLRSSDQASRKVFNQLLSQADLASIGVEIMTLNILSVKPNKETARALEAETREKILKEADDALYERRNSSVEQERRIKENELNTEIAVENKKRQIRETQMDAEKAVKDKQYIMLMEEMAFKMKHEQERKNLVQKTAENARVEADAAAYSVEASMRALSNASPELIKALSAHGMKPEQLIAHAFNDMANNAQKIGELNITPDLLERLMEK